MLERDADPIQEICQEAANDRIDRVLACTFAKSGGFPGEPGVWQFVLRADGIVKYRNNPGAADRAEADRKRLAELKVQLDQQAKEARAAVEPVRQALMKAEQNLQSARAEAQSELEAIVTTTRATLLMTEKVAKDAEEKTKRANNEKSAAEARAKAAIERAKERDVKISTYSLPITVSVTAPAPKEEGK